jgi:hypothetical protein
MIGGCGLDSSGSGQEPVAGCYEHSNEPPGSIKGGEFLDQLGDSFSKKTVFHGVSNMSEIITLSQYDGEISKPERKATKQVYT